jgi:aryl-alcohol dehydrogenase-like predicted oxidoreductase
VSILGYGAMALRQRPAEGLSDEQAERMLHAVLDAGVNFIDTAPDYGESERRIGQFIAHRRAEYHLATKCGCNIPRDERPDTPGHLWTRPMLLQNIETSLRRLRTDRVDIWQLHNPSPEDVQREDLVRVMEDVQRHGKARHVAISSTLPHIDRFIELGVFASFQIPYSALERGHEDAITRASEAGAGIIIRGGVAKGEPAGDLAAHDRWRRWAASGLDDLRGPGESRSAFLLRFTISHPHLDTTIVGTKDPQHLAENLEAVAAGPLPAPLYEQARRRLDQIGEKP